MKFIKKFNESIEETNLDDIMNTDITVTMPLNVILSDSDFLIRTDDGKIFEYENGDLQIEWESDDEFKEQTGASLDDEYAGNKSEKLLDFIKSKCDDNSDLDKIEGIYLTTHSTEQGRLFHELFGQL